MLKYLIISEPVLYKLEAQKKPAASTNYLLFSFMCKKI